MYLALTAHCWMWTQPRGKPLPSPEWKHLKTVGFLKQKAGGNGNLGIEQLHVDTKESRGKLSCIFGSMRKGVGVQQLVDFLKAEGGFYSSHDSRLLNIPLFPRKNGSSITGPLPRQ